MSVLKEQKLVENAKNIKFKWDILSDFQTMWTGFSHYWEKLLVFFSFYIQKGIHKNVNRNQHCAACYPASCSLHPHCGPKQILKLHRNAKNAFRASSTTTKFTPKMTHNPKLEFFFCFLRQHNPWNHFGIYILLTSYGHGTRNLIDSSPDRFLRKKERRRRPQKSAKTRVKAFSWLSRTSRKLGSVWKNSAVSVFNTNFSALGCLLLSSW